MSWDQAGPKGPAGAQGPAGAPGSAGVAGAPAVTLWAEVNASGQVVASSGVTNVAGNASGRFFTFNRDISKCGVSATLNEGPPRPSFTRHEMNFLTSASRKPLSGKKKKWRRAEWISRSPARADRLASESHNPDRCRGLAAASHTVAIYVRQPGRARGPRAQDREGGGDKPRPSLHRHAQRRGVGVLDDLDALRAALGSPH